MDGTYFMHRALHSGTKITSPDQCNMLVNKFLGSLKNAIVDYRPWGILFTKDSKPSWRHTCDYYEEFPQMVLESTNDKGYKGTRKKKDDDMDWDTIDLAYNKFLNIIQEQFGVYVLGVHKAEADDIMAYVGSVINGMGYDCFIFSADGDANQSLNDICYRLNPQTHTLFLSESMREFVEDLERDTSKSKNPKFMGQHYHNLRYVLSKSSKFIHPETKIYGIYKSILNIVYICPFAYMLEKIIRGDDGDNIHAINLWRTTTKTNKVMRRKTTPTQIKKFVATINEEHEGKVDTEGKKLRPSMKLLYDEKFIDRVVEFVVESDKSKRMENKGFDTKKFRADIRKGFYSNRRMVLINKQELPSSLLSMLSDLKFNDPQTDFKYSDKIEYYRKYLVHVKEIEEVKTEDGVYEIIDDDNDAIDFLMGD